MRGKGLYGMANRERFLDVYCVWSSGRRRVRAGILANDYQCLVACIYRSWRTLTLRWRVISFEKKS